MQATHSISPSLPVGCWERVCQYALGCAKGPPTCSASTSYVGRRAEVVVLPRRADARQDVLQVQRHDPLVDVDVARVRRQHLHVATAAAPLVHCMHHNVPMIRAWLSPPPHNQFLHARHHCFGAVLKALVHRWAAMC